MRKTGRMEFFYREMRLSSGILMSDGAPEGGQWNFDADNPKALPRGVQPPVRCRFPPDEIASAVMELVAARFGNHFGDLEPFGWAVTRTDALAALDHFITDCLPGFGDYQNAMKAGEDFLFHGLISPYLNCGLLTAPEVCARAKAAYRDGAAPLNAVVGFVRQLLGWREFVRGMYWAEMPGYPCQEVSTSVDDDFLNLSCFAKGTHAFPDHTPLPPLPATAYRMQCLGLLGSVVARWMIGHFIEFSAAHRGTALGRGMLESSVKADFGTEQRFATGCDKCEQPLAEAYMNG